MESKVIIEKAFTLNWCLENFVLPSYSSSERLVVVALSEEKHVKVIGNFITKKIKNSFDLDTRFEVRSRSFILDQLSSMGKEIDEDREKFLKWLKNRVASFNYKTETAPGGIKEALISGSPEDLEPGMRFVWEEHFRGWDDQKYRQVKPVNPLDPTQEHRGPRGGRYTKGKTKEGRLYRRYF